MNCARISVLLVVLLAGCTQSAGFPDEDFLESVRRTQTHAEKWFLSSIREDKPLFTYIYDPVEDASPTSQNELRQLMASRLLAQMSAENRGLKGVHRMNADFILKNWYEEKDDIAYILFDGKSKLGANAMLLRAFVASPDFDERYREHARKTADGILSLMNEDGSFRPWLKEPDYEYDSDYLLTFYSGEAILALLEYANAADSRHYYEAAVKAQDYSIDLYVTHMKENYYPAYVPWHTQSLRLLYDETGDMHYAEAVFLLNDELLKIQDTTDVVGRFYDPDFPQYGSPHSSSDAVYTEGLAHAYHVARKAGDSERAERYRAALTIAVENLQSLQYSASEAKTFPRPKKVAGAIRISKTNGEIRVDCVQHAIDAYRAISDAFLPGD